MEAPASPATAAAFAGPAPELLEDGAAARRRDLDDRTVEREAPGSRSSTEAAVESEAVEADSDAGTDAPSCSLSTSSGTSFTSLSLAAAAAAAEVAAGAGAAGATTTSDGLGSAKNAGLGSTLPSGNTNALLLSSDCMSALYRWLWLLRTLRSPPPPALSVAVGSNGSMIWWYAAACALCGEGLDDAAAEELEVAVEVDEAEEAEEEVGAKCLLSCVSLIEFQNDAELCSVSEAVGERRRSGEWADAVSTGRSAEAVGSSALLLLTANEPLCCVYGGCCSATSSNAATDPNSGLSSSSSSSSSASA